MNLEQYFFRLIIISQNLCFDELILITDHCSENNFTLVYSVLLNYFFSIDTVGLWLISYILDYFGQYHLFKYSLTCTC